MSADFFRKKIFAVAGFATAFLTVIGAALYARFLDKATVHAVSENFYFLVSDSTHIEVSTHQVVGDGGAGYLLEQNGRDYVAISAYLSETNAKSVQNKLDSPTLVLSLGTENLYFKTREEKANAKRITGAFSCLKSCIGLLDQEIARLDNGATQQSSKRILNVLQRQFVFLEKEYKTDFSAFSLVCKNASEELEELASGTVLARDLRYLLCELCVSFVDLSKEFSL